MATKWVKKGREYHKEIGKLARLEVTMSGSKFNAATKYMDGSATYISSLLSLKDAQEKVERMVKLMIEKAYNDIDSKILNEE